MVQKSKLERMNMLTQGSIVMSVRSKKYPNCNCYGVIISARCDIANRKIEKIYYLEALDLKSWIFSDVCFSILVLQKINPIIDKLKSLCISNDLQWDTIKNFSLEEFITVVNNEMTSKQAKRSIECFEEYKLYSDKNLTDEQKKAIFKDNLKSISSTITDIAKCKYMHYAYIPSNGIANGFPNGIVVDLQELDYFDFEMTKDLELFIIDNNSSLLSQEKQIRYNEKFVLDKEPGYAMEWSKIESPWVEYLMQRFSNVFIRIGVDNPSNRDFESMIDEIINEVSE